MEVGPGRHRRRAAPPTPATARREATIEVLGAGAPPDPPKKDNRLHTKISLGIINCRINPETRRPEALLIRKRCTYAFAEFVYGHYPSPGRTRVGRNTRVVEAMIDRMLVEEKLDLQTLNFQQMWHRIWLLSEKRELYHKKLAKFQSTWMRDDGGALLTRLVEQSRTIGSQWWEFPKGKRQSNREADINCAIREFEEETGLRRDSYQLLPGARRRVTYVDMGVRYVCLYYLAIESRPPSAWRPPTVDLRNREQASEVGEIRWMDIEEIRFADRSSRSPGWLAQVAAGVFNLVRRYHKGVSVPRALAPALIPADIREASRRPPRELRGAVFPLPAAGASSRGRAQKTARAAPAGTRTASAPSAAGPRRGGGSAPGPPGRKPSGRPKQLAVAASSSSVPPPEELKGSGEWTIVSSRRKPPGRPKKSP